MTDPTPYDSWPDDRHARWVRMGHCFGRHVMRAARDYAFGRIPTTMSVEQRRIAERAALDAIYGVMMLLDGVANSDIDHDHCAEYVLIACVRRNGKGPTVEQFELAPDGDGLCMGFHAWVSDCGD
jgi:hypothetical protein